MLTSVKCCLLPTNTHTLERARKRAKHFEFLSRRLRTHVQHVSAGVVVTLHVYRVNKYAVDDGWTVLFVDRTCATVKHSPHSTQLGIGDSQMGAV